MGIPWDTPRSIEQHTLWLFNIAMENGPFIDGLPGFTYQKRVVFHSYAK